MTKKPTRAQKKLDKQLHAPLVKPRPSLLERNNDLLEQNRHLMQLNATLQHQLDAAHKHLNDYANVGQYVLRYRALAEQLEAVAAAILQMGQLAAHVQDLD